MAYTEESKETLPETLSQPSKYRKAIMAAALAGATGASFAANDGFTGPEVWGIVAAVVAAFVGVFGVANAPTP